MADGEMSEQESETSRFPIPHPSASESAPLLTFLLTLLNLETHHRLPLIVLRSSALQIHLDSYPEKRTRTDDDYGCALLSVYQHDLGNVSENLNDDKVCAGEQCD